MAIKTVQFSNVISYMNETSIIPKVSGPLRSCLKPKKKFYIPRIAPSATVAMVIPQTTPAFGKLKKEKQDVISCFFTGKYAYPNACEIVAKKILSDLGEKGIVSRASQLETVFPNDSIMRDMVIDTFKTLESDLRRETTNPLATKAKK